MCLCVRATDMQLACRDRGRGLIRTAGTLAMRILTVMVTMVLLLLLLLAGYSTTVQQLETHVQAAAAGQRNRSVAAMPCSR